MHFSPPLPHPYSPENTLEHFCANAADAYPDIQDDVYPLKKWEKGRETNRQSLQFFAIEKSHGDNYGCF